MITEHQKMEFKYLATDITNTQREIIRIMVGIVSSLDKRANIKFINLGGRIGNIILYFSFKLNVKQLKNRHYKMLSTDHSVFLTLRKYEISIDYGNEFTSKHYDEMTINTTLSRFFNYFSIISHKT